MIGYIFTILVSFLITFIISFPFIRLLYKFNIRRISKAELDAILPGRQIKFGTPIMGGAVILVSILILSTLLISDWQYYPMVILITIVGGIFGFIDEYVNTLERTLVAVRKSKNDSLFPVSGLFKKAKEFFLKPWRLFEESIRVMGSEQRGMKAHYKLLMQLVLAAIPLYFFWNLSNGTFINFSIYGDLNLSFLYWPLAILYFLFFINAFGIADGMDGLSAGSHSIAFTAYGIVAAYFGYQELAYLAFIIVGAELAFLYFNINPARMEMSDVGTMPIGVLFAVMPIIMHEELSILFIGALFIIEILSSISQQWSAKLRNGKRIFLVAPIHHHFEKKGWPETKVVERFWLFVLITSFLGIVLALL